MLFVQLRAVIAEQARAHAVAQSHALAFVMSFDEHTRQIDASHVQRLAARIRGDDLTRLFAEVTHLVRTRQPRRKQQLDGCGRSRDVERDVRASGGRVRERDGVMHGGRGDGLRRTGHDRDERDEGCGPREPRVHGCARSFLCSFFLSTSSSAPAPLSIACGPA